MGWYECVAGAGKYLVRARNAAEAKDKLQAGDVQCWPRPCRELQFLGLLQDCRGLPDIVIIKQAEGA